MPIVIVDDFLNLCYTPFFMGYTISATAKMPLPVKIEKINAIKGSYGFTLLTTEM
jgi:hypothetical protein